MPAAKTTAVAKPSDVEDVEDAEIVEEVPAPKYRVVRNSKQIPKFHTRLEPVDFPEIEEDGEILRLHVAEMTEQDYSDLQDTNKVFDERGNVIGYDYSNDQAKTLSIVVRDEGGNRLWPKWQDAVAELSDQPVWFTSRLVVAANQLAMADPAVALKKSKKAQS